VIFYLKGLEKYYLINMEVIKAKEITEILYIHIINKINNLQFPLKLLKRRKLVEQHKFQKEYVLKHKET
jgi:hypothetical protein